MTQFAPRPSAVEVFKQTLKDLLKGKNPEVAEDVETAVDAAATKANLSEPQTVTVTPKWVKSVVAGLAFLSVVGFGLWQKDAFATKQAVSLSQQYREAAGKAEGAVDYRTPAQVSEFILETQQKAAAADSKMQEAQSALQKVEQEQQKGENVSLAAQGLYNLLNACNAKNALEIVETRAANCHF